MPEEEPELQALLGSGFDAIAIQYLIASGLGESEATAVLERAKAKERERERRYEESLLEHQRHDVFLKQVLYLGLHPTYPPCDEEDDSAKDPCFARFEAEEFGELLTRGRDHGAHVDDMFEFTRAGKRTRWCRSTAHPEQVLARWLQTGDDRVFSIRFKQPIDAQESKAAFRS